MCLRTGMTVPWKTLRKISPPLSVVQSTGTHFPPSLWVSCPCAHCVHCAWVPALNALWKWAAAAPGEALASWLGTFILFNEGLPHWCAICFQSFRRNYSYNAELSLGPIQTHFFFSVQVTRFGLFSFALFICPCFPSVSKELPCMRAKAYFATPRFVLTVLAGPQLEGKDDIKHHN